jgi:hypothetical protein
MLMAAIPADTLATIYGPAYMQTKYGRSGCAGEKCAEKV